MMNDELGKDFDDCSYFMTIIRKSSESFKVSEGITCRPKKENPLFYMLSLG